MVPKPITREDMYYDFLINGSGTLPEPITRKEMYLHYLCVNGFGVGGGTGESGGVSNYNRLTGKPQINGVTLQGNLTSYDLGIKEFSGNYKDLQGAPQFLPSPFPVTFGGMLQNVSYDGSEPANITFPDMETTNKSAGTPVGEIISYMGVSAPPNYLACDGMEYPIADYPYLARHFTDELGTANYFGGDGETTFAVPDLRGEFLRGTGTAQRNTGSGAAVGVHQDGTSHLGVRVNQSNDVFIGGKINTAAGPGNCDTIIQDNNARYFKVSQILQAIDTKTYTARPTNTAVMFCIKCRPTYFMSTQAIYSYEERPVGIWVDGKTLYEKTIFSEKMPSVDGVSTIKIPVDIDNLEMICCIYGIGMDSDTGVGYPIPYVSNENGENSTTLFYQDGFIIVRSGYINTGRTAYITVRYTKSD